MCEATVIVRYAFPLIVAYWTSFSTDSSVLDQQNTHLTLYFLSPPRFTISLELLIVQQKWTRKTIIKLLNACLKKQDSNIRSDLKHKHTNQKFFII